MAIDHRIIQQIGIRDNAPALNMFQNTLSQVQNRNIQQQQADQQAELQPFRQQLLEQQAAQGAGQLQDQVTQRKLKSINDFAIGNQSIINNAVNTGDPTQLQSALAKRREQLISQNLPTTETDEALVMLGQGNIQGVVSGMSDAVRLFNQQQGRGVSVGQRDFETKVNLVKNDPELLTPAAKAAAIDLGLKARASTSAQERISSDPELTDAVASSQAQIAGAKAEATEGGKLKQQRKHKPAITALVKLAEKEATERGETITALQRSKAALPGLTDAVNQLKELSSLATSTFGGKVFDFAVKQTGFGSTQGATSRAKFIAIVNNQVLPLLKETFGAAFTATEGESLKATMGDPDASPEEKMAQLDAFIAQKTRDIETKERQLSQTQDLSTGEFVGFKVIR